ncbi:MAG TPA: hypothetical protein VN648_01565 [Candidatus Methylomirabilis sp.]|nr:hypothetical protein [Candidatus Methylomirabilis sp.]
MRLLVPLGTLLVVAAAPPAWIVHAPQEPACCLPSAVPANVAMNAGDMIDGAEHSELIPDSIAYRLFFLTVASLPTLRPSSGRV